MGAASCYRYREKVVQVAINRNKVLEAAKKHQRKGNIDKAILEYRKLVEDDPGDMRSMIRVADLYARQGKTDAALESYKTIAYHYLNDDIYDKASAFFKQAIRLDNQDPKLYRDLGEAFHRMGRLKEAVGQYHLAQRIYESKRDIAAQRDILERMVRLEPEEPALRIKLAEFYIKAGMREEAVGLFRYAAQQFEDDGRLDDYIKVSERIIYLKSSDFDLRKKILDIYLDNQDFKKALKHLQVLFQQTPTDLEILRKLSICFERLGQHDKLVLVLSEQARIYGDRGEAQRSLDLYRKVLQHSPNHKDAKARVAYYEQRQRQAAPQPQATPYAQPQHARPQPQQPANPVADIEFLDDDLEDVLAPSRPAQPQQPSQPAHAFSRQPQTQHAQPQLQRPQQPARGGDDLFSFAEGALSEFEDIGIDDLNVQQYPGQQGSPAASSSPSWAPPGQQPSQRPAPQPQLDPEPVLLEPEPIPVHEIEYEPQVAKVDEEKELRIAIDEARVFIKYGLIEKAVAAMHDTLKRFPHSIEAREELAGFYVKQGQSVLAADQFIEIAKVVKATPQRAAQFLESAANLLGSRASVEVVAQQFGIPFGQQLEVVSDDLVELDVMSPSTMDIESEGLELLDDEDLLLVDADSFDSGGYSMDTGPAMIGVEDGLDLDTDDILNDDELIELDDMDLVDMGELDDVRGGALPEVVQERSFAISPPTRTRGVSPLNVSPHGGSNDAFGLTEDEADAMFDDLFGDSNASPLTMSFSGSQDLAGIAEVDFLIEQGLMSEAEDALDSLEQHNPTSATIQRRRLNLENMRTGAGPNPFGSRSLSKHFAFNSVDDMIESARSPATADSVPSIIKAGGNTNFELGAAYMEMGLFQEAIEEFQQSLDDREVADGAAYNIAMCEVKLGKVDDARRRLQTLLARPTTSHDVRHSAQQMLQRLG